MSIANAKGARPRTTDAEIVQSDASLVARLRAGEDSAFEEMTRAYTARLYAMAYRMLGNESDASDAVQDAFLGAFKTLSTFDGRSQLSTWLTRIVINKCLMKLRSKRRRPECSIEPLLPTFKEDGHPTTWTSRWKGETQEEGRGSIDPALARLIREKVEELPEQYRQVLLLRDIQQLSTEEAAHSLGDTPNAVKVRLHRARQALRALIDPYMSEVIA
ncbi:MAG: sigma-70 family RNA polymerase sigma factor [Phycisphaerales bacterium]